METLTHYYDYHWYLKHMGNAVDPEPVSTRLAEFIFAKEIWMLSEYKPFCFKDTQPAQSGINWDKYLDPPPCDCGRCEDCNQTGQYEL